MKIKVLTIIVLITLISACSMQRDSKTQFDTGKSKSEEDSIDFVHYLNSLNRLSLPFNYSELDTNPHLLKNYDKSAYKKFKLNETDFPFGIIFYDKKVIIVIDCVQGDGIAPIFVSYDKYGKKIDSLSVFGKTGWDVGYDDVEYLRVTSDKVIRVIDTLRQSKLNKEEKDVIEGTKKTTITTVYYKINDNGRFIKKSEISSNQK